MTKCIGKDGMSETDKEIHDLRAEVERLEAEVKYLNGANDNLAHQLQKLHELGDACERHCVNPSARTAWREYREDQSDETTD